MGGKRPDLTPSLAPQAYLARYGWMDQNQLRTGSLLSFSAILADFQIFAGLQVTGQSVLST